MRGFLALTGILVALVVAFLVAWPRLVDVPALRGEMARLLREVGGDELRIDGAMRLELLPLPRVAIERAVIGDRIAAGPGTRFTADRIDVELAPWPLLTGRIEPSGLQLVRPRLELTEKFGSLGVALVRALTSGPLAGVRRVDVVDGALRVGGSGLALLPSAYDSVDLVAVRDGDRSVRLDGSAAIAGAPMRLNLTAEPLASDAPVSLTLRLEAGPRAAAAVVEFGGQVAPGPSVDGTLRVNTEQGPAPAWLAGGLELRGTADARLSASSGRVGLADLAVTLAEGQLRGAGSVDLTAPASFDLNLEGASFTASPGLIAFGRSLLAAPRGGTDLSGRVRLELASLTWHDAPVRRLRLDAGLAAGGRLDLKHLDAILPGQAALSWTGTAGAAADAISGELSLQAGELRPLLAWLGVAETNLPPGGFTSLDLNTDATIDAGGFSLRRLRARLDASQLEGSLSYAIEPRQRLDVALTADRLNTALYQASPAAWADWRARLEALDGTVDFAVDRLSHDILRGQGFRLRAALDAGRLDFAELRLVDFAGAGLDLTGTVDLPLGAWDVVGDLRLPEPKPILRLLRVEPPLEIDRLAPLRLHAESRREAGATSLDLRLEANGAEAALKGQLTGALADGAFDLSVTAQAQETSELLVALGWPAPAERPAFGPLAVSGNATRGTTPIAIKADARAGDDGLLAELTLEPGATRPRLSGSVRAPRLDEGLVAALYETLALPLDFPPGSPWLWPGIWPAAPLGWSWLDRLDLDLALEVAALRDQGRDAGVAGANLALDGGVLAIQGLQLPVAGGTLTGTATLEGKGDHAVLGADLRLSDARAEDLAAAAAPGSTIQGEVDVDAALLAQGRSIADLVASLSGTGSLTLQDARLTGVELGDAASAAQIEAATLSGPFAIAAGTLASTAPGLALNYPGGSATVDLRLDLSAWILEAHLASNGVTSRYLGPPGRIRALPPS